MNIFVGSLAYSATPDDLTQLFESYGEVERVQIITDRDTGQARGFGFVEMPNDAEARAAIAGVNGTPLHGRPLNVTEARPREGQERPRRPRR